MTDPIGGDMKAEEYRNLERVEGEHWYYSGKREIVEYWIRRSGPLCGEHLLVDVGAGTGAFAASMQEFCQVLAVDSHAESLEILRERMGSACIREGGLECLPLGDGSADIVTALDVLEHVEDDGRGMQEIWRILKPGGRMVITVPANMWLWSDWDESLGHYRRYSRRGLKNLVGAAGAKVIHENFMNFFALPAVFAARMLRRGQGNRNSRRAEDVVPPKPVNALLKRLFVWSSVQTTFRWPAGVGLLCVAVKPGPGGTNHAVGQTNHSSLIKKTTPCR
jgi:SAM-dependent methyltransferase